MTVASRAPERTGWTCTDVFGVGPIPTAGAGVVALPRHQLMQAADDGEPVSYAIDQKATGLAEAGVGIYSFGSNTIARTAANVKYSTAGAQTLENFGAGEKVVRITPTGADLLQLLGRFTALDPGTPSWDLNESRSVELVTTGNATITAANVAGHEGQIYTLVIRYGGTHTISWEAASFDLLLPDEKGSSGIVTPYLFVVVNGKLRPMVGMERVSLRTRGRSGTSRVLTQDDDGDGPYAHVAGDYGDLATYFFREPAPPTPIMVLDSDQCRGAAKIILRNEYDTADLTVQRPGTAAGPNITVPAGWNLQLSGKADATTNPSSAYWDKVALYQENATAGGVSVRDEVLTNRDIIAGDTGRILCGRAAAGNVTLTLPTGVLVSDTVGIITIDNHMSPGQLVRLVHDPVEAVPRMFRVDEDISTDLVPGVEIAAGNAVSVYRRVNDSTTIRVVGKCTVATVVSPAIETEDLSNLTLEDGTTVLEIEGIA